jgi:hypothetical protein
MNMPGFEYRSYIIGTLYGDPADLLDPGFEDPAQGTGPLAFRYNPTGSAWIFSGLAGVAGNGSGFTAGNPAAPQGGQVAFLQKNGAIGQVVNFPAAGSYTIGVNAAQRGNLGPSNQTIEVRVDGVVVGTFAPAGTGYALYTTGPFHVSAGSHAVTFIGVNPSGADFTALLDRVRITNVSPMGLTVPGFVNLTPAFNRTGIVADGTAFSGGLDGLGSALSSSLVGTILVSGGVAYGLGPAGVPNVVSAAGQVIALPHVRGGALKLLATGVHGPQRRQTFLVTYTDGTTAQFRRSISDWASRRRFAQESTVLTTHYRNTSLGTPQAGRFRISRYSLALDPTKEVRSLTLPANANVKVFAATLLPADTSGPRRRLPAAPRGLRRI